MEQITSFITLCEQYAAASGRSLRWISRHLLHDARRLEVLKSGNADIGVKRLGRALSDLALLTGQKS